jgi:hypothetical protein
MPNSTKSSATSSPALRRPPARLQELLNTLNISPAAQINWFDVEKASFW